MLFLAKFALRGQSQAALAAATLALLGLLLPPAAWVSGAVIGLVALVKGADQGGLAVVFSAIGAAVFSLLIFDLPHVALIFLLMVWLPVLFAAAVLRKTVSLALSLQALTAIGLLAVLLVYVLMPNVGEVWREVIDQVMTHLSQQGAQIDDAQLAQTREWLIDFLPGMLVSSVLFGAIISLLLARWWQAVLYNPGGFADEFQGLNLGRVSALIAAAITLAAMLVDSVLVVALMSVMLMLYLIQGLSLMHAMIRIRKLNGVWLVVMYLLIFFIPHLVLALFIAALFDPWLDFRKRTRPAA